MVKTCELKATDFVIEESGLLKALNTDLYAEKQIRNLESYN